MKEKALVFANGSIYDGPMPRRTLAQATDALIIAADGGVRVAEAYGVTPDIVVGDMDSVALDALTRLQQVGARIETSSPEKDETDLELALLWAVRHGVRWMRIFGAMGGRLDQTLANIYLLALPALRGCDVRLVSESQATWLLYPGNHTIVGTPGDTLSLLPLDGPATGIYTDHLYYPLYGETLRIGPARGVSNVMQAESVEVRLEHGLLLVVHTLGRA